jgi:VIT1/CCC1 family predicted Fe2+/Mn2+ transporter
MSLTLFKSWLFPETTTRNYTALPSHSPHHDSETGLSHNSTTASTHAPCEKSSSSPNIYSPKRLVHPRTIADATIGLSDGLTVPFALTAGLSTLNDPKLVIYGGLAELIAGSISMGLGGYLAARSEAAGYQAALSEVRRMVEEDPWAAGEVVRETFADSGFSDEVLEGMVDGLVAQPEEMVGFLMRFQRLLTREDGSAARAVRSGATISGGYFMGGLVPLVPYLVFEEMRVAFVGSVVVMILTLFAFGWVKTALLAEKDWRVCLRDGVQMVVLGSVAAGAAMGCVKAVGG